MKQFVMMIVVLSMLGAGAAPVQAAGGASVEAGIKMWLHTWWSGAPGAATISSDTTMLLGPAVDAQFGEQVFLHSSYLISTADYRFSEPGYSANISRRDADLAIGYLVIPEFGLFAGYRQSTFKENTRGVTNTLAGLVMGLALQAPMDRWLFFYGKLMYLFTEFDQKGGTSPFSEDSPGWGIEFGLKYRFTKQFAGSIGYRFEENTGKLSDVNDSFGGLTLSAMLLF